jgi:hypothetical protein
VLVDLNEMGLPLALSTLIRYAFSLCQQKGERVRGRDKRQKMISARAGKNACFGPEPLSTKHHAETNTWRASQSLCTHTCTPCTCMHTNTYTHTRGLEQRHFWRVSISRSPLRAMADKQDSKVIAPVQLLREITISSTFENFCRAAHRWPL